MYLHHASCACRMCKCGPTSACKCIDSEFESVELVDYAYCLTLHVAALALQALTALLTHTLATFPGPNQLFIICSVWSCGVKMLGAHCSAPHVAALALQAPKATHTRPSIFKVENLKLP